MSTPANALQPTIVADYRAVAAFQAGRFSPVALGQTDHVKVVLTCFEPGQFIPVHTPGIDVTLVILEGEGTIVAGDQEAEVRSGAVVIVPAGAARGVKATTRLIAVHLVSPPPTEADHAEVQSKLRQGSWR
ncbi:MAG: cupin domain-containing protein [Chloroflexi bacterium]|nr:cupin domain-containing protein [Chloroflexota bacterium]